MATKIWLPLFNSQDFILFFCFQDWVQIARVSLGCELVVKKKLAIQIVTKV
jgi:hypothetical protein